MIRLEHAYYLYGLLLIPIFIIIFWIMMRWKKKALKTFGDTAVIQQLFPDVSKGRPIFKFILLIFAYIFLIIGLVNPQIGSKLEKVHRKGISLIVALDISNSMLAEDIKPSRLEASKYALSDMIENLGENKIGIIVFAGTAYTQLPITTDLGAANLFASTINTGLISEQGTSISSAIDQAIKTFDIDPGKEKKAIILISDGEDMEHHAIESAEAAAKKGIVIYTIGIGSPEGAPIPIGNNRYKTDKEGNTVMTKLNEPMLQQLAAIGNGKYVRAGNNNFGLKKIYNDISKIEKTEFDSKIFSDYEDRFQYFIAISALLLLIEIFIFERRSKWARKIKLFS